VAAGQASSLVPRLSVRHQVLLVVSGLLLLAMGTYLYIATSLFSQDKRAYVYDLQSSLVETLSEQTAADLSLLAADATSFAHETDSDLTPAARNGLADDLFIREGDVLRVEVFAREGATWRKLVSVANPAALKESRLTAADLALGSKERPVPLEAVEALGGELWLQNSSLPPDAALLTLASSYRTRAGTRVVTIDFRHDRLLRLFGRSTVHRTFLVNERGQVLAHPDAQKVIGRADLSGHALVKDAMASVTNAVTVKEFKDENGTAELGAFAKVRVGRLVVVTELPLAEALSAGHRLVRSSVLFAVAILLAAFVVSVFFSRALTAPIIRLREATETIARGRFDIRVDKNRPDEIGDLARAFESMAGRLEETQAQLIQAAKLAAVGQLGAGITHEVKNPLAGIVGMAQLARARATDPKLQEMLDRIERSGQRCVQILNKLLTFARPEARKLVSVDANVLVAEADKLVRHQLKVNKVELEVVPSATPALVLADAGELQQVLLNLAINAQQAMAPKGGQVRMSVAVEGEDVRIDVTDDGPGIPDEVKGRIFEPFFTTKATGEGTGLGLSVSAAIVQDHRGSLTVASEVGKGTTFTIRLPGKAKAERTAGEQGAAPEGGPNGGGETSTAQGAIARASGKSLD
jgi:two-component system NtrC family sensor kinase